MVKWLFVADSCVEWSVNFHDSKDQYILGPCHFSPLQHNPEYSTLYSINSHFDASTADIFRDIVEKEEIARNKQFLLFLQRFLLNQIIVSLFVHIFTIISLFDAELEEPKIGM